MSPFYKVIVQLGSAAAMLTGCAHIKPSFDKELPPFFYSGLYGAKGGGPEAASTIFKLATDGSYKLSRSLGGCTVEIEDGRWNYLVDHMELRRRQSLRRQACNFDWNLKTEDTLLVKPLRAVTYFSFQMSSGDGTEWIEFVPLAKLSMDMAANGADNSDASIVAQAN
jgi:hypothetical protein